MSGLTSTGFEKKTVEEILAEISAELKANLSSTLNTKADSLVGVIMGVFSTKLAEMWEVGEAVYASQYPDSATGIGLDNVASITGAVRLPATKSTVTVTCTGTPTTIIPAGSVVSDGISARFVSLADGTIGGGGTVDIDFESEDYGPIVANAGTLETIETPVGGWSSCTNASDADLGRDLETDADFRLRRIDLLALQSSATYDAIRAQVLDIEGVEQAFVFGNDTATTVGDLEPHTIEVVVDGGDSQDIVDAIQASKAAGIGTYGTSSGTATDSQGFTHTIYFTRPTQEDVEMNVVLTTDDDYQVDGDDQVKAALAAYVDTLTVGDDVIRNKLFDVIFNIAGVVDVPTLQIRLSAGVFGTANLTIGPRALARADTSDITVTS